jgi:hypothetical protein
LSLLYLPEAFESDGMADFANPCVEFFFYPRDFETNLSLFSGQTEKLTGIL